MTFFSHRPGFSDFPFLFPDFQYLLLCSMSYMTLCPLLTRKTNISEKNSLMTRFFTLFVLSRASDNTTSQNIGGTDAWAVPPPQILGVRPTSPPRSLPLLRPSVPLSDPLRICV